MHQVSSTTMHKHWINFFSVVTAVMLLSGCVSSKPTLLPEQGPTMAEIYQKVTESSSKQRLADVRSLLQITEKGGMGQESALKMSADSLDQEFIKMGNPDIGLYIMSHFVSNGNDQIPIPAYITTFSLFLHIYY